MQTRPQRTLKKEVTFAGVGLHTGKSISLTFCPAPEGSGICFQRTDLRGAPKIPATVEHVHETVRSTTLKKGDACVQTVEHVLSALYAYQIDNLCIQVTDSEMPIGDGSASAFVDMIENAGVQEQNAPAKIAKLKTPVYFSQGETHLVALPSDEYRISYTLHYPQVALIKSQYYSCAVNEKSFKQELATCRTFVLYDEIKTLMERGLIRGGSLENAVVIKEGEVIGKEGLRFADEMVRHKTLDLIGDLALVGFHFLAHVIAIRSGHTSNVDFGKQILKQGNLQWMH